LLAALGLAGVVLSLTQGPAHGWSAAVIVSGLLGIALLVAFLVNERVRPNPMMPLDLFRSRQFSAANLVTFVVYGSLSGALFLLPVQLQIVSGFSPVAAGSALLPVTVVMLLLSARMGRLAQRIGPRWPMTVGPMIAAIGMALLARLGPGSTYVGDVLPAVLVFAVGLSVTVAPLTATVLAAAPEHQIGVASAVNNDVARTAGLLAVAVLPALAGITPEVYADPAALSSGFHRAVLIAAVLCASGGLLSAFTIRDDVLTRPAGRPARPAEPELAEDVDFAACRCQAALTTPTLPRR
jgi:predicted MFS family arabinose efflux permease